MSSTPKDTTTTPTRRRFRLRWLSWIVLLLVTPAMVIIIMPGSRDHSIEYEDRPIRGWSGPPPVPKSFGYDFIEVETWSHGWPFEYLRRAITGWGETVNLGGNYPITWSSSAAWIPSSRIYALSPLKLLANLVIGVGIVVAAVGGCERWRRRRGAFRFSLLDGCVLATLICIVLGWWQYHTRLAALERATNFPQYASSLDSAAITASTAYCGPKWLERLIGNPAVLSFCEHDSGLYLGWHQLSASELAVIPKLRYVERVHCAGHLERELADSLAALPNLRALDLTGPKIVPSDIRQLSHLHRLETLKLSAPELLIEDLDPIAEHSRLKTLELDISATRAEREAFTSAHPSLNVNWVRPNGKFPDTPSLGTVDPALVTRILLKRWHFEDGSGSNNDPPTLEEDSLYLRPIRLTQERAQRIPQTVTAPIVYLTLGQVDSPQTAMVLIKRCSALKELDCRHVPLTIGQIRSIPFADEAYLHLQQGPLSPADLCAIAREVRPTTLVVFGARIGSKEVSRLAEAVHGTTECYKGFEENENDWILDASDDETGGENPFL